jgi:D-sedoheptulose 7-phosphate isomerase
MSSHCLDSSDESHLNDEQLCTMGVRRCRCPFVSGRKRRGRDFSRADKRLTTATDVRTGTHAREFFNEAGKICAQIDVEKIEGLAEGLAKVRDGGGRLFILGVGGSAGNASHAVNDFRKLCGIEAYSPVDNVSELTARTNDEGFETIFSGWLEVSKLSDKDAILIYSVGGGDAERKVSVNLVQAIDLAKKRGAKVFGIVGKDTGYTAKRGDIVIVVPQVNPDRVTPLSEAFQAVVWHCLVSNPKLQVRATKW